MNLLFHLFRIVLDLNGHVNPVVGIGGDAVGHLFLKITQKVLHVESENFFLANDEDRYAEPKDHFHALRQKEINGPIRDRQRQRRCEQREKPTRRVHARVVVL